MKLKIILAVLLAALSGCANMKPAHQALLLAGAFGVAAIAVSDGGGSQATAPASPIGSSGMPCSPQPDGSCR